MLALQESVTATLEIATGPRQGKVLPLATTLRIGRHPYNELSLDDPTVSRYHCWIMLNDGGPVLEDLASSNGTFVNGAKIHGRRLLRPGDRIRVGETEFTIRADN